MNIHILLFFIISGELKVFNKKITLPYVLWYPYSHHNKRIKTTRTIGLMLRSDKPGVTSVIRDLALSPGCYDSMLHFFRASSWSLDDVGKHWFSAVREHAPLYREGNFYVLVGDGVKQSKEGRRMPGVKKLFQETEAELYGRKSQIINGILWFCSGTNFQLTRLYNGGVFLFGLSLDPNSLKLLQDLTNNDIDQALFHLFFYQIRIGRKKIITDKRILLMKRRNDLRQKLHDRQLSAAAFPHPLK